jgi:succinyl-CoA synthetase beta subunit
MQIHEYQAKKIIAELGVPVLKGSVAYTVDEAVKAAKELGGNVWVVKAQIHAGGRGKAGGVKIAKNLEEVSVYAKAILGAKLITPQTGPQGKIVRRLYIEEGCALDKEYYVSLLMDPSEGRLIFMASAEGGVEIEEIASKEPHKIIKVVVDPTAGFQGYIARKIAFFLGLKKPELVKSMHQFLKGLYEAYMKYDASMIEINPLALTKEGKLIALDAKVTFDDNGLFRQPNIMQLRDLDEEDPHEVEAASHSLNYIKLAGNIGCLVNGAGLAMATMDIIKLYGGEPANFLDVGGGATKERVTAAFKLILSDPHVEAILVNIFGGIMRCDIIAEGVVAAAREIGLHVPLVVRLEGTNVDLGKKILYNSGLSILTADNLADAAQKAVVAAREAA